MNWQYLTAAAGLTYLAVLVGFIAKRRWTWAGMGVAIGNFFYVLLNLAAPFPGLLTVAAGPMVTFVVGGIAITDTPLLSLIAPPSLLDGLKRPDTFRIELGESLQIPGIAAVLSVGALLFLPLEAGDIWSARRIRPVLGH